MTETSRLLASVALAAAAILLAGCGQQPETVSLSASAAPADDALPPTCLGSGLNLAIGYGTYAVPLDGRVVGAAELRDLGSAGVEGTLCSYVSDHPSPFSTRGGDDTLVCVLIDGDGVASVLSADAVADGAGTPTCAVDGPGA